MSRRKGEKNMGLFNKEPIICPICGKNTKESQSRKCRVADGIICGDCAFQALIWLNKGADYSALKHLPVAEVRDYVEKLAEKRNRKENFPADIVAGRMKIDTKTRKWCWTDRLEEFGSNVPDSNTGLDIFDFDDVEEIEASSVPMTLNGDTTVTNNGVGRAVVGGLLAGSTGDIVGAATAKQTVNSTQTTVTLNALTMKLKPYPGKTWLFFFPSAQDLQTVMDILAPEKNWRAYPEQPNPQPAAPDPAEELRKYKALADEGVITAEDYEAKKKQLLGL